MNKETVIISLGGNKFFWKVDVITTAKTATFCCHLYFIFPWTGPAFLTDTKIMHSRLISLSSPSLPFIWLQGLIFWSVTTEIERKIWHLHQSAPGMFSHSSWIWYRNRSMGLFFSLCFAPLFSFYWVCVFVFTGFFLLFFWCVDLWKVVVYWGLKMGFFFFFLLKDLVISALGCWVVCGLDEIFVFVSWILAEFSCVRK